MRLPTLLIAALLLLPSPVTAARTKAQQNQSETDIKRDIFFLASAKCEGRGPNTKGIDHAADYIAKQFKEAGLKPGWRKGWFQPFGVPGSHGKVTLTSPEGHEVTLKPGHEFVTLGHDQSGKADGGIVFVGYGISVNKTYDDYAGVDVTGKTVVMLRGLPKATGLLNPRIARSVSTLSTKIKIAKKQGAAAIIIVNDEATAGNDDTPIDTSFLIFFQDDKPIPALVMRRAVLERMLPRRTTLRGIERGIGKSRKPKSFALKGWKASIETQRGPELTRLKNVIGVLEGSGNLADETVIVGAHYDHLGYGNPNSSLAHSDKRAIHPGADDNASGTAAMIELARRFAAMPRTPHRRRIVFIAFSGEELRLYGSAHYVKDPPFPLKDTVAMFNLDMVGRVKKDSKTALTRLLTEGHGTANSFKKLLDDAAKKHCFALSRRASGKGPSDHTSFCLKQIPVLFVWTGEHPQYHRPTDTADLVPIAGVRRVVDFSEDVIEPLTRLHRPRFLVVPNSPADFDPRRKGEMPTLGIRPSYDPEVDGIEVLDVTFGLPADKAGIMAGDRIVNIAGMPVKTLGQYINALTKQKRGSTIEVTVVRGKKNVKLKVKLD
jgi:hypothetical protein